MAEVFGNVNVKYNPCKSIAQLKSTADYILGKRKEQIAEGIEKTRPELYNAFGCNRDNFVHMARPNGRFCGAKRPKCEAEQPLGFD